MDQFRLEQVTEVLKKIKEFQDYYTSIIRTRDGLLPRNMASALRELVRGDMDEQWDPLVMAQVSIIVEPKNITSHAAFGLAPVYDRCDQHMSGATRMFIDTKQDTLQIGMRILCEDEDRNLLLLRVYSDRVPQYRWEEDRNYLNVSAAEPSLGMNLLNYVYKKKFKVLGWIAWSELG